MNLISPSAGIYIGYAGGHRILIPSQSVVDNLLATGEVKIGLPCTYLTSIHTDKDICMLEFGSTIEQIHIDALSKYKKEIAIALNNLLEGNFENPLNYLIYSDGPGKTVGTQPVKALTGWIHLYNNGERVLTDIVKSPENNFDFTLNCSEYYGPSYIEYEYMRDENGEPIIDENGSLIRIEPTLDDPTIIKVIM